MSINRPLVSARFQIQETPFSGLKCLLRKTMADERGYLDRLFCAEELHALHSGKHIHQINRTFTAKCGTLRGLHFQYPPHAEVKFVHCLQGKVFDVAVDLRNNSPTFLKWHAEILGEDAAKTLVIPEGFAHGFQTMSKNCEMLYFHTAAYCPAAESGLNPQDPKLSIAWPLPVSELSLRDQALPMLDSNFTGITL